MMVRVELWDRCAAASVLHPSHDTPGFLFACAKPAPEDEEAV